MAAAEGAASVNPLFWHDAANWVNNVVGTTLVGVAIIYGLIEPFYVAVSNTMCTTLMVALCITFSVQPCIMVIECLLKCANDEEKHPSLVQRRETAAFLLNTSFTMSTGVAWEQFGSAVTGWATGMVKTIYGRCTVAGQYAACELSGTTPSLCSITQLKATQGGSAVIEHDFASGTGFSDAEAQWIYANTALVCAVYTSFVLAALLRSLSNAEEMLIKNKEDSGGNYRFRLLGEYLLRTTQMCTAPLAFSTAFGHPWS